MTTFIIIIAIVILILLIVRMNNSAERKKQEAELYNISKNIDQQATNTKASSAENNLNINKRKSENNRQRSLEMISKNYNCDPSEVKKIFLNHMFKDNVPLFEKRNTIQIFESKSIKESDHLDIPFEDTPSYLMANWAKEYFISIEKKNLTLKEVPEKFLSNHSRDAYLRLLEDEVRIYGADIADSSTFNDSMKQKEFMYHDKISYFIVSINMDYLHNFGDKDQYYHFLGNSLKAVKNDYDFQLRLFPDWFLTAYPDVSLWVTVHMKENILPQNITNKIYQILNMTPQDRMSNLLDDFYEIGSKKDSGLNFSDLRILVDTFKTNNTLECLGA